MGLDLFHIVPVPVGEPCDGSDVLETKELNDDPILSQRLENLTRQEGADCWRFNYRIIGYQRKGMKESFGIEFPDAYYYDRRCVEDAYQYLRADHIGTLEERQANFRANFIDNYIDGVSIFLVSS